MFALIRPRITISHYFQNQGQLASVRSTKAPTSVSFLFCICSVKEGCKTLLANKHDNITMGIVSVIIFFLPMTLKTTVSLAFSFVI